LEERSGTRVAALTMSRSRHLSSDGELSEPDPRLVPVLAMTALLPAEAALELGRALHAKLNAPPTAAERRVKGLGFLARVLDERVQYPERLPYVPRDLYELRRTNNPSLAPPSARLQERFGSWARACHAAWGLLEDGRSWGPGEPWGRPPRHAKNYEASEAEASVRRCSDALGRVPSSSEYHGWVINRRTRARDRGESTRPFVHYASVLRLLARDRSGGNGWRLVVARVFEDNVS
jgi:hypothetical protein